MNTRRLVIALVAALTLSGLVTLVVSRKISAKNRISQQILTNKIVAAAKPLQPGEAIKAESLTLIDWPSRVPLQGTSAKIEDLVGRFVLYPVAAQQPIVQSSLAPAGSGFGLTAKIPDGMRATSVRSDEVVGVAGFLFPGSHVDVLVTFRLDNSATTTTQTVLQDAEVLTAGQKSEPDPQAKPDSVGVVTLLLKPDDAEKLVLASSLGSIHFVLRNGSDHEELATPPARTTEFTEGAKVGVKTVPTKAADRLPKKQPYVVETLMGEKRGTAQFE